MMRAIVTRAYVFGTSAGEYVVIEHTQGEMHVLLAHDKSLQQSLIANAADLRERARRLLRQANLIDQARALL
jgi:hypothetical protein